VEWYVSEEIRELRRRGVRVFPCSGRRANPSAVTQELRAALADQTLCLEPLSLPILARAIWLLLRRGRTIGDLLFRILFEGSESAGIRLRALAHTLLGANYAVLLQPRRVEHIHVHHGYFSSWVALVAARLLGIPFSITLHGSDLLLHGTYMDMKLTECAFCVTISEFNRTHILAHYPGVDPDRVRVQRLGVPIPPTNMTKIQPAVASAVRPLLLSVGRLHSVKNHAFLLQGCYLLRECGIEFQCFIAGDGPERCKLEFLIAKLRLGDIVTLLGHLPRERVQHFYDLADLVVLTSRSEGIPLVLMEAMAHGKIVLAPAITGIPELVIDGKTGFLYRPEALEDFVWRLEQICKSLGALDPVRRAAREHVMEHFQLRKNLQSFGDFFLGQITKPNRSSIHADSILQQI